MRQYCSCEWSDGGDVLTLCAAHQHFEAMWNTDLAAAPRGVDLFVSVWSTDRLTCSVGMGVQVYEPYEWEDGEESGGLGDTEGTFDMHDGQRVCWYWLVGCDGYTDKKEIAAWQPAPAPYTPGIR